MLNTNLKHLMTKTELQELIDTQEKVAVVCGRMGPMCIPVYEVFEVLEEKHPEIAFRDMEFDNPESSAIRSLPECRGFAGLPYTVYFRNGKVVKATSSIQTAKQIKDIIGEVFA